jgi:hypothetical protein
MRRRSAPAKGFADERPYNDMTSPKQSPAHRPIFHLPPAYYRLDDGLLSSPESQQIPSIACLVRISQNLQLKDLCQFFVANPRAVMYQPNHGFLDTLLLPQDIIRVA